jgi:hypothetical protein
MVIISKLNNKKQGNRKKYLVLESIGQEYPNLFPGHYNL